MPEPRILISPSRQKKLDRCRLLYQLQYLDRWEPREAERSLPARLRGNAFSLAMELIHKAIMEDSKELLDQVSFIQEVIEQAINRFNTQFKYCIEKGIIFLPNVEEISRAELRRVIPQYAHHTPVRQWQQVFGVEHSIPAYSSRPDIQGINAAGFHVVGDGKYKSTLDARYANQTEEEYHWDPQFQQYPLAHRHDRGLDVSTPVYSTLLLVVGSPFRIRPVEWLYTPEQERIFFESAKDLTQVAADLAEGRALPRAAAVHRDNFGWCPMKRACLELNLDPELMKQFYVQLELPE